jgi:hypothetical protein
LQSAGPGSCVVARHRIATVCCVCVFDCVFHPHHNPYCITSAMPGNPGHRTNGDAAMPGNPGHAAYTRLRRKNANYIILYYIIYHNIHTSTTGTQHSVRSCQRKFSCLAHQLSTPHIFLCSPTSSRRRDDAGRRHIRFVCTTRPTTSKR